MKSKVFSGLITGATLIVSIIGNNTAARANQVPAAPVVVQKVPLGSNFIDLSFHNPSTFGNDISGYDIWASDNAGISYALHYTAPAQTDVNALVLLRIPASPAIARLVKVRVNTAAGSGYWSDPVDMYTTGARPMRVYVQAPDGTPIIGGSVTWKMPTNSSGMTAHSSVAYGLTTDGYIDLPSVPAGHIDFKLVNGELPNGVLVSGTLSAIVGFKSTVLQIVRPPDALHVVNVVMPNGLPISGVQVDVNSDDMTDTQTRQGFTFTLPDSGLLPATPDSGPIVEPSPIPTPTPTDSPTDTPSPDPTDDSDYVDYGSDVIDEANYDYYYWDYVEFDYFWVDFFYWARKNITSVGDSLVSHLVRPKAAVVEGRVVASGQTNTMGRFVVKGFTNTVPTATVSYDDGVISQSQVVQLQKPLTTVELPYAPFVSAGTQEFTANENATVSIPVVVASVDGTSVLRGLRTVANKPVVLNKVVKVKVIPPKGATKGTCRGIQSTYTTTSKGKVSAKVCATLSGNYIIKSLTPGVRSLGAVRINVKGAAPSGVQKLRGLSKQPGKLFLSWSAPKLMGGAKVTSYQVTYQTPGHKKSIRTVTTRSILLSDLSHAKKYVVTVRAKTKHGLGANSMIAVPVV